MSLTGLFTTMSMPDLVQWARTAQRTGLLTLESEGGAKTEVAFRNGRIVFTSTNARREAYSRYLVYRRYCTQADIDDALGIQQRTGIMMASVLVRKEKLTEKDAIATLTEKTFEDLCSIFLWPEGSFMFTPQHSGPARFLPIDVDPIEVVMEGVRRSDMWSRMGGSIHPRSWYEANGEPFPEGIEWEDEGMARLIRSRLDGETSMNELVESLPFSRYKIYRAVSELLDHRLARPSDSTGTVDREARLRTKLAEVDASADGERFTEAMELLQGLSSANPGRKEILDRLIDLADRFRESIYRNNFTMADIPVMTVGLEALAHLRLDPVDGFLLSRIDGRLTVQEILRITPVREFEGLRCFKRLLRSKVIDFPHRRAPL